MVTRSLILAVMIAIAGVYATRASGAEATIERMMLAELPLAFDDWRGRDSAPFDDDIVAQLGVDEYINRHYVRGEGQPIAMYVGYYASQRQGDTIHSPQNCLPGAGWRPVLSERVTLEAGGRPIEVNRYLIQKGMQRQAVLYWYQGRGRVVANEYANKLWLMVDAARLRRTDGALVRLIAPVVSTPAGAFGELADFAAAVFPRLAVHLP
jgi:EpsI family protein